VHPVLADRRHLALYLAAWGLFGVVLAWAITPRVSIAWWGAAAVAVPLCAAFAFICLASWYPVRAHPLESTALPRVLTVHLAGAVLSAALWQVLAVGWTRILDRLQPAAGYPAVYRGHVVLFVAVGLLLYLLAVALHYLLAAAESSRRAAHRALKLELATRRAELDAFKAQVDPHFLFNCLNSISSLCGTDPAAARGTAIRLGELLRASLELGARDAIPLHRELELARSYLAVERVRYGDRLRVEETIGDGCRELPVPALVLQPLLENALKHGIAHLVSGGRIELGCRRTGGRLQVTVRNPVDSDRPPSGGAGIGLANVRGRLKLLYGDDALLTAREDENSFEVELVFPARPPADD